jgi:hypothetical protein
MTDTHTHRQYGDGISLLPLFQNKESWLKMKPTGGMGVEGGDIKVYLAEIASGLV